MLERAKARREKLDEQLTNAGHDVKKRRSPLKDANALLKQAAAAATESESLPKSPVKSTRGNISSVKSPRKSPVSKSFTSGTTETNELNKENGEFGVCSARSKLQRLGQLYSDDDNYILSSPIHKTEEKFSAEEDNASRNKPIRKGARLDRLAALASTINNWEDDLSHPTLNNVKSKPPDTKAERIQAKFNEQVKATSEPQPGTSRDSKWISVSNEKKHRDASPVKQLKWDKNVLESLESNAAASHLSPKTRQGGEKGQMSPGKSVESPKIKRAEDHLSGSPADSSKSDGKCSGTAERMTKSANTTSSSRLPSRTGFNGSPKTLVQPSGSVLSKASMFEAKNMDARVKDPAQTSLAERMAFFERNRGQAPLIPKAPLTMSIPPKKLQEKDRSNVQSVSNADSSPLSSRNTDGPSKTVFEQRAIFESNNRSKVEEMENRILQATHAERQRELGMLRARFNANRDIARAAAGACLRTSESSEGGGKQTSPKGSLVCPVKPTPAPDNVIPPPPPPPPPQPEIISYHTKSSIKRQVVGSPPKSVQRSNTSDIKRIRVCPPKPGALYPNLSEIEVTESETDTEYTAESTEAVTATLEEKSDTETVSEADYYVQQDETEEDTESERENMQNTSVSIGRTSFGRSIMHELNERSLFNKKRSIEPDPDSSTSDISVLDEMDQYLDECLEMQEEEIDAREEGPTPPKVNKSGKSPLYNFKSPLKIVSPVSSPKKTDSCVEDGGRRVPLVRTVSAYRRQQSELTKTPVRSGTRPAGSESAFGAEKRINESILVEKKVKQLLDEVCTQQKKIEGASKALNLCYSTIEFNGSSEHVGGEWALLVATHKRQAALNEVQRLKREGTLRPVKAGSPEVQGSGSLTISAITLPLKSEHVRNIGMNTYLHCVCLMYHLGEVIATQAATAEPGDSCLRFTSTLKLDNLHSDFRIGVEVYSLQTQPKSLPHEKKYHINHNGLKTANKTPKKKNQFVMPDIQSPAGPNAIRSPAFQLCGSATITLDDINREQFTLHGISSHSLLEGHLRMRISRKLAVSVEHRGFLTIFEDISNLGFWHRRWCWLKDAKLYYWVHPEDEHKKNPVGHLDLEGVFTKNVQFVNREKCARPFTFLLETSRAAQPGDADGLIMKTNGIETTTEHFLLADTREEGLQWMSKFNKTLSLIRAWGPFRDPA